LADYNPRLILHGEAVGIGIIQAMILSNQLGYLNDEELKLVLAHFNRLKMINFSTIKH
jgi:3-dehydroquinate synthetase